MNFPATQREMIIIVLLPHVALQLSGFGFDIPRKRHPDGNRIWPQYRWEALIFCLRSLSLLYLAWYQRQHENDMTTKNNNIMITFPIVMSAMMGSDFIKWYYPHILNEPYSRTIRDLKGPMGIRYLMSCAQFHATFHSIVLPTNESVQMAALAVVQISAFGMTLRRKRIISQSTGVMLYGLILVHGMIIILHDLYSQNIIYLALSFGNIAALLRLECHINKYVLWTFITIVYQCYIQTNYDYYRSYKYQIHILIFSTCALFIGAYKRQVIEKQK